MNYIVDLLQIPDGRLSNYRDEKVKASVHIAFQQNKQLEVRTLVIVISAVVVSERSSLVWHNKTYMQSSPAARTKYPLETCRVASLSAQDTAF